MHENEFRDRLRHALGEPPTLAAPMLKPSTTSASRAYPRGMAAVAIALAVLLVLVFVASRVALRPQGTNLPAAQAAPDSFPCSLAVEAISTAQNPGQNPVMSVSLGFVNIPGGGFQVDPAATVVGLPVDAVTGQNSYSAALKRWVPASTRTISPDGLSYTYVKLLPAGASLSNFTSSELHVFDVAKNADRKIWSGASSVQLVSWDSAGILVAVGPVGGGGPVLLWHIDPATGAISQAPMDADPTRVPTSPLPSVGSSYLGSDRHGQDVYRLGTRDKGTEYSIVVVASGRVTTLYAGTVGDSMAFDPAGVYFDAHGLWLGNLGGSRVWLWSQSSGLRRFPVTGLPPSPAGYAFTSVDFIPAGTCMPGPFAGVAAKGLPAAATPTPSPAPPAVDWSALTAKPLKLEQLPAGAACPVSPPVQLTVKARASKWPNYGLGPGPAYLSGQLMWYSAGGQGVVILTDPTYTGPVLVRSQRLDGTGSLAFSGQGGTSLADGSIGLAQTSAPPYWGTWAGSVTPSAPGCYGIQLDGTGFTAVAVIDVKQGPPPPG
jgi:hypothetical protein